MMKDWIWFDCLMSQFDRDETLNASHRPLLGESGLLRGILRYELMFSMR